MRVHHQRRQRQRQDRGPAEGRHRSGPLPPTWEPQFRKRLRRGSKCYFSRTAELTMADAATKMDLVTAN